MDPLGRVLSQLEAADCRPRGNDARGYTALCPAHDDRSPSLSVCFSRDRVLLHCFSGCEPEAVLSALGLEWRDLFEKDPLRA